MRINTKLCSYKGYDIHWCTIQKDGDIIIIMAGTLFDEPNDIIERGKHYIDKLIVKET